MGEYQPRGQGRQLRRSTLGHQPGQYTEMPAHGVEKPAFTIPDPVYDPELARHCAFPTIPLDQHPGPCEVFEAERASRQSAPEHSQDGDTVASAGDSDKSDQDDNYEFVPTSNEIQEGEKNESPLDPSLSYDDFALSGLERGESFKDFALLITNDLDWGSPEPEQQTGSRRTVLGPSMFTVSQEPLWSSLSEGVQWILVATVCKSHTFFSAMKVLRVTRDEIYSFIQTYVKHFDENALWSEKVKNAMVSGLIQQDNMDRPALPTDLITRRDIDSARAYLTKIRCEDFCEHLSDWQGISRAFIELPIDSDIVELQKLPIDADIVELQKPCISTTAPPGLISPQEPSGHSIGRPELDEQSISGPVPTQPAAASTVDPQTQHEDPQSQADTGSPPPSPVVPSMLLTILELEKIRILQKLRDLNSPKEQANRDSDSEKKPANHDSDSGKEPANQDSDSGKEPAGRDLGSEKKPADDDLDSSELPDERFPEWEAGLIFQRWLLNNNPDDKMEYERYRRMPLRVQDLLVHDQSPVENSARPNGLGHQGSMSDVQTGFSSQGNESNSDPLHTQVAQKAVNNQQADSHGLNTFADAQADKRNESSRDHQPAPFLQPPVLLPRPEASLGTFVNTEGLHTGTNGMPAQQVMPMGLQKRGNFASEPTMLQHHRSFPNMTIHPQQQANYMHSTQKHMPTHQQFDQNYMPAQPTLSPAFLHQQNYTQSTQQHVPAQQQSYHNTMQPAHQNSPPAFQDQRNYTQSFHHMPAQQRVRAPQHHYRDYVQPAQQHVPAQQQSYQNYMQPAQQNSPPAFQDQRNYSQSFHHVPTQQNMQTDYQHHGGFEDLVRQTTPTRFQHHRDGYGTPAQQNVPTNFQHHGGFANLQQNSPTGFQPRGDYTTPAQQNVPTGIQHHASYTNSAQQSMPSGFQHRSSLAKPAQQSLSTDLQHRDNFAKPPEQNITAGLQERGSPAERQPASQLVTSPKKRKSPKPKYVSMADALEDDGPGMFVSVAARHAHNVLAINSGDNRISEHVSPYLARPANTSATGPRFKPTSHKAPVTRSNAHQAARSKGAKDVIVIDDESSDDDSEDSLPGESLRKGAAESSLSGLRADDSATLAKKSAKPNRKRPAEDSDEDYEPRAKKPRKANPQKPTAKKKTPASAAQGAQTQVQTSGEGQQSSTTEAAAQPPRRGRGRPRKYPRPEDLPAQAEASQGEQGGNLAPIEAPIESKAAPKRMKLNGGKIASSNTQTEMEGGAASADALSNTSATEELDHHLPVASKELQTSATRAFAANTGSDSAWDPASLAPPPQAPLPPANFALVAGEDTEQIGGQNANRGHMRSSPYSNYQEFWKVHENGQKLYQEATLRGAQTRDTVQGHNRLRADSDTEALPATALARPAHDSLLRQATTAAALQSAAGLHSRQVPVQEGVEAQNFVGSGSDTATREKLSLPTSKGLAPIRSPSIFKTIEREIKADKAKKAAADAEEKPETPSN